MKGNKMKLMEMQIVEPDNKKIYVRQLITEEKQREKSIT